MSDEVERMLAARRGFTPAAAGCGKTQLIGQVVLDPRSGRQLVLTHTHAGVAALRRRFREMKVPERKFRLDTIAGWSLRYATAYPGLSDVPADGEADPDWPRLYPGAEQVIATGLGREVLAASYDGVLVDEYQDCTISQHRVVEAMAQVLPCRAVGDPLQSIFGFRDDPTVSWEDVSRDFEVLPLLETPWRWRQEGRNEALGDWLVDARQQLRRTKRLTISPDAPVRWIQGSSDDAWAASCRDCPRGESAVAIVKWPKTCVRLARRLRGRWPIVEKFDHDDLPNLAATIGSAPGPAVAAKVFDFLADRVMGVRTELRTMAEAAREGRSLHRFQKHPGHRHRMSQIVAAPAPESVLAFVEGILAEDDWWLYRPESVHQLRSALRELRGGSLTELSDACWRARTASRHRGRLLRRRTIGTTLLVKGLEFDHAVVLEPENLGLEGLYVAITRGAKSLTVVSESRTIHLN